MRQLDKLSAEMLKRAWGFGIGPKDEVITLDIDSTICQVYGERKQGSSYDYTKILSQHPLVSTLTKTGEVLHIRHRKGSSQLEEVLIISSQRPLIGLEMLRLV